MISSPGVRRFTVTESREAVEVTADNLDEVAAWCEGKAYADSSLPHVMYDGQDADGPLRRMLMVGNMLVTDGTCWWDVTREEFERDSEQWTEETWAKKTRSSWSAGPRRR